MNKICATSEESSQAGSEYIQTHEETSKVVDCSVMCEEESKAMEQRFFVCETTQVIDLVNRINETSKCSTKDCNGKLLKRQRDFLGSYLSKVEVTTLTLP